MLRFIGYGFLVMVFLLSACGTTGRAEPDISFEPFLLPVKFTITASGVAIAGNRTLVTPLGLVSIGAKVGLPAKGEKSIRVIIRDRNRGNVGFDDIYDIEVGGGNFEAVTNGITIIQVTADREVIIDITDGEIKSIEFRGVAPAVFDSNEDGLLSRWGEHWQNLPFGYYPWDLTRFAYDDSTIDKWYGVGFLVFLARLIAATLLAVVDLLLSMAFLFAAIFYVLLGETGRNVCYGFIVLFVFFVLWMSVREWRYSYE